MEKARVTVEYFNDLRRIVVYNGCNMKLEKQVVSLELSKKLKSLGVKQESLFKWNVPNEKQGEEYDYPKNELKPRLFSHDEWERYTEDYIPPEGEMYSAYTVAELGEMFEPIRRGQFERAYCDFMALTPSQVEADKYLMAHNLMTDSNIAAGMLIYLLENKLIEL